MSHILGWLVPVLNRWGEAFCSHASAMLFQSLLVVGVVFVLDRVLRRRVRASVRYWIWMLVLIKLVLPLDLPSPISLAGWTVHYGSMVLAGVKHHGAGERGSSGRIVVAPPEFVDNRQTKVPWAAAGRTAAAVAATQPSPHEAGSAERSGDSALLATGAPVQEGSVSAALQSKQQSDSTPPPLSTRGLLFVIWGTVITILLGGLCVRLMFVRAMVNRATPAEDRIRWQLEAACRKVGILPRRVRIRISDEVSSPVICGILRPTVLLPTAILDHLDTDYARTVFVHELTHLKRWDMHASLFQAVLQVLWFYNPVVWVASRVLRILREQAVDETVVTTLQQDPADYSETLVLVASLMPTTTSRMLGFVSVLESHSSLKERIDHLFSRTQSESIRLKVAEVLIVLACVASLVPGSLAFRNEPKNVNFDLVHDTEVGLLRGIIDSLEPVWNSDIEVVLDGKGLVTRYELITEQIAQKPTDLANYLSRAAVCDEASQFISSSFFRFRVNTGKESGAPVMFHGQVLLAAQACKDWAEVERLAAADDRLVEDSRISRCNQAMLVAQCVDALAEPGVATPSQNQMAWKWLDYAERLRPDCTWTSFLRAMILERRQEHEKALRELDRVIPLNGATMSYYATKSKILQSLGRNREALAHAIFAHRLAPNSKFGATRVAGLYLKCGEEELSERELRHAETLPEEGGKSSRTTVAAAHARWHVHTSPPDPPDVIALVTQLEQELWEKRRTLPWWEQFYRDYHVDSSLGKKVSNPDPTARRQAIATWLANGMAPRVRVRAEDPLAVTWVLGGMNLCPSPFDFDVARGNPTVTKIRMEE